MKMKTPTILRVIALSLAVLVGFGPAGVLHAQTTGAYYFWWQVTDERGEAYTGQNVQCSVYRPQQHAAAILHTGATLTSGGNSPLFSDVNGKLHFYTASDAPVDLTCWYEHGGQAQINRFRVTDHKITLPRQSGNKISRFSVNSTAATYQTNSGIDLPAGALIHDIVIQNLNPLGLGTYHLSVGFLGNHSVATAISLVQVQALNSPDEWLRPHWIGGFGTGLGGGTLTGNHRGTALSDYHTSLCLGGVCGSTAAGISRYIERPYLIHVATGLTVSYSAQPGTAAAVRAHVFLLWTQFHSGVNRLGRTN